MERSPVRNLAPDFDFSIEPDTPECPPTKRYKPVNFHEYTYPDRVPCMAKYHTKNGKVVWVEYKPLMRLDE